MRFFFFCLLLFHQLTSYSQVTDSSTQNRIVKVDPEGYETVLGIRIGLPRDEQLKALHDDGKVLIDGHYKYYMISYDDFRAHIFTHTYEQNGVHKIKRVVLSFNNLAYQDQNATFIDVITPKHFDELVRMYQTKYGEGTQVHFSDIERYAGYVWNVGDIIIELNAWRLLPIGSSLNLRCTVTYMLKPELERKLLDESYKNKI
jgi:hypothetical protein